MDAIVSEATVRVSEPQADASRSSPTSELGATARQIRTDPEDKQISPPPKKPMSPRRNRAVPSMRILLRKLATACVAVLAVLAALVAWDLYNAAPWTRNGRVRVQVASVAPQISGQIKEVRIVDNQFVRKGDILYIIDAFDFEVALHANKAALEQKAADLKVKELQSERRSRLSELSTSIEQKQLYEGNAIQAKAALDIAQEQVRQAQTNLQRTAVRSPVNGVVTNLLLREGDYAHQGTPNISIIDTDSYWVDGYFEETKLARLCVGDRAEAKLMGYPVPIIGHVSTVTRGVSVSNAAAATQGLPTSTQSTPGYVWRSGCRSGLRSIMCRTVCRWCPA